tara:strand:- start:1014 stop:1412 length:399 start_codon:yes stop_codon:yes gene_type:complete
MQKFVNRVFVGFMAGLISSCVMYIIFAFIKSGEINFNDDFKYTLYRLMVWGGVWAMLFALPISKNILIKSSIIGVSVILFNFLVKMPMAGQGFFAINEGLHAFLMNIVFNFPWAILAGMIYVVVADKNKVSQ